jgi:hypothetical protein
MVAEHQHVVSWRSAAQLLALAAGRLEPQVHTPDLRADHRRSRLHGDDAVRRPLLMQYRVDGPARHASVPYWPDDRKRRAPRD